MRVNSNTKSPKSGTSVSLKLLEVFSKSTTLSNSAKVGIHLPATIREKNNNNGYMYMQIILYVLCTHLH